MEIEKIQRKWKCCSCDGISVEADLLKATNPFDETMKITGCPICKDVVDFIAMCDEPECIREASCGFPTSDGYRHTCGGHIKQTDVCQECDAKLTPDNPWCQNCGAYQPI